MIILFQLSSSLIVFDFSEFILGYSQYYKRRILDCLLDENNVQIIVNAFVYFIGSLTNYFRDYDEIFILL